MRALLLGLLIAPCARAEPRVSVESRSLRPGEILLVSVEDQAPGSAPEASFMGQKLDFFPAASTGSWLAFAALDLNASTGTETLQAMLKESSGRAVRKNVLLQIEPSQFPVQELQVQQKFVTPPKSDSERAEGEASKLYRLFTHGEEKRLFEGRFESPIPGAPASHFGERRIFNGQPRAPHSGMDLKAKKGTPIRAPAAGRVVLADSLFFQGKTVVIDHGLGLTTLYAHLSKVMVQPGDMVRKGQVIGKVGATGRVTGAHLHWALKLKTARVDPFSLTALDLDARLRSRAPDPLKRSPACDSTDLPPAPKWGPPSGGLRARIRPLKAAYAQGEALSLLVEVQNIGKKNAFLDLVLDPVQRSATLGFNRLPQPAPQSWLDVPARLPTTQIKIPRGKILCFEQDQDAGGPLLASSTDYTLYYGTELLYTSTSTARAGIWRGRLTSRPIEINISGAVNELR